MRFARGGSGGRGQSDRIFARGLLRRTGGSRPDGDLVPAAPISFLDDVRLQGKRTDHAMKLQEQSAGVAQRMPFRVATPQRGGLRAAVCTRGWSANVLPVLRSARAPGTRRRHTAEAGLWRRIR